MRTTLLFCTLAILLFCTDCSNVPVPDELKTLYPVTIIVTDGNQAIEGVAVSLSAKTSGGAWASCGVTNVKGVAVIQTSRASYTGKGAPAGDYKVILIKTVKLPPELEPQEEDQRLAPQAATAKQAKLEAFYEKNRVIPKILENSNTSPIELMVAEKDAAILTIDIAQYKK
ncbi:MAG: Ig-like domain-containing protein [Planctomycetaceae bacterium]|nr:Ig-like domain-containing protein [Planctomycetaceae bacterium]